MKDFLSHIMAVSKRYLHILNHKIEITRSGACLSLRSRRLADSDVPTKRAWVVVLEVVELGATGARDLVTDALASGAHARDDGVAVAGHQAGDAAAGAAGLGGVGVGGAGVGWARQDGDLEATLVVEGVAGCLEVGLLGEEEDEGAGLAGVGGGEVEVQDGGGVGGDGAVVGGAGGGVGGLGGDGDHQVRVLVLAREVGWAGLGGGAARWSGRAA